MFLNRSERAPSAPGWDGLISCAYSTSFDGTKRLSVSENSHATLYEEHEPLDRKQGHEIAPMEGTWSFDESSKRYLVALNGETTTYVLVNLEGSGMCMLIAGDVEAAIRADTLPRILAHWRSLRKTQKERHFIKYEGELYAGDEVDKLQT
jgi:hypothetical protein